MNADPADHASSASFLHRVSLRTRVTAVAAVAISAAVTMGVLLLYLLQVKTVEQTLDDQLRTYAAEIQDSASDGAFPQPLPPSSLDPGAEAQVISANGSVLSATRGLSGRPAIYALPPASGTPVRQKAADGVVPTRIRVVAVRARVSGRPVVILTGTDVDLLEQLQSSFKRNLAFALPGVLLFSVAAMWLVVGRALRPVQRILAAVGDITSDDLSRRVPEPPSCDEIGDLARTMNQMLARLDGSAQRQRRFVADASHELRSPLAAIRTTLEVGLAHRKQAPWPEIAERAAGQALRLEELIDQLLVLAKADELHLGAENDEVSLSTLLQDVCASTNAGGFVVDLESDPAARVMGSAPHLSRMCRNVIDNAVRHARARIEIRCTVGGERIEIEIEDDGTGIRAVDRERVFGRFVRLDESRDRASGSSGLGLAIALEIAHAHGGEIALGERPGGGTRASIRLPAAADC